MSKWTMKGTTGETVKVTPEEFRRYWDMGFRPVSDKQTAVNDYETLKRKQDEKLNQNGTERASFYG